MNLLCESHQQARENRLRVEQGYCNRFYASQGRSLKRWKFGVPPPKRLIIGELPYLDTRFRIRTIIKVEDKQ